MKIRLRLNEPVSDKRHQDFILGTAFRDTVAALMFHSDDVEGCYFPENPFTFSDDGTSLEATITGTVTETNVQKFKQTVMETINNGLRGNTTKIYEPASDFPKIQIKAMEVENEQQKAR